MAGVIDIFTGKRLKAPAKPAKPQKGERPNPGGTAPDLLAMVDEHRAVLQSLVIDLLSQGWHRGPPTAVVPIWRPERPFNDEVRRRLWDEWGAGQKVADAAIQLVAVVQHLADAEWELKGRGGSKYAANSKDGLVAMAFLVCQREVWRQFHLAPRLREHLAWKRKRLSFLEDQAAGALIVAADEAWMERINGAMARSGRSHGASA